jgi:hypothetical protein
MKRVVLISLAFVIALSGLTGLAFENAPKADALVSGADWQAGRIIDDDIFYNGDAMTVQEIQIFLNEKVPTCDTNGTQMYNGSMTNAQYAATQGWPGPAYVCLKDYHQVPRSDQNINNLSTNVIPTGAISASQIIKNAAVAYNINPKALLVTLEKESLNLIKDNWPLPNQYRNPMGYGCPDTAPCDPQYEGFYNQMMNAARQFKLYKDNPNSYRHKPFQNIDVYFNPQASCGTSSVYLSTYATAGLYNYTPYQPNQAALNNMYGTGDSCSAYGNRNFWRIFTDWFGGTQGSTYYMCRNGENLAGAPTGPKIVKNRTSGSQDTLSLVIPNNTGTKCAEVHTWANAQAQTWIQHTGTNSYTFDPRYSTVVPMRVGGGNTRFFKIDFTGTVSGKLEVHGWDNSAQHWLSHVATASWTLDPTSSAVIPADRDGDGIDELYTVDYRNTSSGMVEIHGLTSNFQQWILHTVTALPAINPAEGRVIAADTNGDGKDEFSYIKYANVQSNMVEIHTLSPNFQQWVRHAATNMPVAGYNNANDDIVVADTDGRDGSEIYYVKYSGSQSGRVEIHGWNSNQSAWISHTATSAGSF